MAKNTAQRLSETHDVQVLEESKTPTAPAASELGPVIHQTAAVTSRPGLKQAPPTDMSKYAGLATKSDKIRAMFADGIAKADIGRLLDIKYQHVRNVLTQPMKRAMVQQAQTPAAPAQTDETKAA